MSQLDAHTVQEGADTRPLTPAVHAPPSPFACEWEAGCADGAWVEVAGELDLATSPQLRTTLQEAQAHARLIALDLRAITFMDTSGVHAILDATTAARSQQRRLILVCGPGIAEHVLTLTAANDQLEIIDLNPTEPAGRALLHLP